MKEDTFASCTLTPRRKVTPRSLSWVRVCGGVSWERSGMAVTTRWLPATRRRLMVNFTVPTCFRKDHRPSCWILKIAYFTKHSKEWQSAVFIDSTCSWVSNCPPPPSTPHPKASEAKIKRIQSPQMNHSPREMPSLLTTRGFFPFCAGEGETGYYICTPCRFRYEICLMIFPCELHPCLIVLIFFSLALLIALFIAYTLDYAVKIIPHEHILCHKIATIGCKRIKSF